MKRIKTMSYSGTTAEDGTQRERERERGMYDCQFGEKGQGTQT